MIELIVAELRARGEERLADETELAAGEEEEVDGAGMSQMGRSMKKSRKPPEPKKWLGCEKPVKTKTRSGKRGWKTKCVYFGKKTKKVRMMVRMVGYGKRPPKKINMGGKPVKQIADASKLMAQANAKLSKK